MIRKRWKFPKCFLFADYILYPENKKQVFCLFYRGAWTFPSLWPSGNFSPVMTLLTLVSLVLANAFSSVKIHIKMHFLCQVLHAALVPSCNPNRTLLFLLSTHTPISLCENMKYLMTGASIICIWFPFQHVLPGTLLIINPHLLPEYIGDKHIYDFSLCICFIYTHTNIPTHTYTHMSISSTLS